MMNLCLESSQKTHNKRSKELLDSIVVEWLTLLPVTGGTLEDLFSLGTCRWRRQTKFPGGGDIGDWIGRGFTGFMIDGQLSFSGKILLFRLNNSEISWVAVKDS